MSELPTSPGQAPHEVTGNDGAWLREFMVSVERFDYFKLEFEQDKCECADDAEGTWAIEASKGRRHVAKEYHSDWRGGVQLMWYVEQHMDALDRAHWDQREKDKAAAKAKLTDRERALLGIT